MMVMCVLLMSDFVQHRNVFESSFLNPLLLQSISGDILLSFINPLILPLAVSQKFPRS